MTKLQEKKCYAPYGSRVEFLNAQSEHGVYVRHKDCYALYLTSVNINGVIIGGNTFSYETLLDEYVWEDGEPCGIIINY